MATKEELEQTLVPTLLSNLEKLLGRIEFGTVELTFHHGKLVQLEKKEKFRLDQLSQSK
ncbi:MAG: YezD family protein [Shewanella sp.]|uniref:DUF2292 domain-containing protein n=2 Tax=Shewanella TaxID=22 RepID=Q8E8L2_SHEON|nr:MULTISPECIES: DUF2292 domain-containing protein [Shewanella]AAN57611.1 protein of unknown function DUF2292 [Shewanella oneidensis MR-1]MCG9965671.1 YezD family protein [Shewanella sp. PS-2]MDX5998110.1 YezD family protein [Shewanella oneidensis]MEE2026719.1 hypothetical protein [Shewanella oneidensis]QKG94898.1 YezD family protein [Shewanella oneidensis MR-1]